MQVTCKSFTRLPCPPFRHRLAAPCMKAWPAACLAQASTCAFDGHAAAVSVNKGRPGCKDKQGHVLLKSLTLPQLEEWCTSVGEPPRRAAHLFRWLYGTNRWIRSLDDVDGQPQSFSSTFKAKVAAGASLCGGLQLQSVHTARDGTHKLVHTLIPEHSAEGVAGSVETVLIPMTDRQGDKLRYTACVSTQVGCAMNCQFCLTGRMGLMGNLTAAQVVEQVVSARRWLAQQQSNTPIANVVFMGMGEPLHNYDATLAAIDIMAEGLELARTKIIVSTVGLVPRIRDFLASGARARLAVSLHATTDEVRNYIVPTNRRYPLEQLMGVLREHFPVEERKGDRFVVIEYILLKGINDSLDDARRLAELTSTIYCMVNLIVFNPHEGTRFQRSDEEAVQAFRSVLISAGRICTVRHSKGDDAMAACGQLGDVSASPRPAPRLKPPAALRHALTGTLEG